MIVPPGPGGFGGFGGGSGAGRPIGGGNMWIGPNTTEPRIRSLDSIEVQAVHLDVGKTDMVNKEKPFRDAIICSETMICNRKKCIHRKPHTKEWSCKSNCSARPHLNKPKCVRIKTKKLIVDSLTLVEICKICEIMDRVCTQCPLKPLCSRLVPHKKFAPLAAQKIKVDMPTIFIPERLVKPKKRKPVQLIDDDVRKLHL